MLLILHGFDLTIFFFVKNFGILLISCTPPHRHLVAGTPRHRGRHNTRCCAAALLPRCPIRRGGAGCLARLWTAPCGPERGGVGPVELRFIFGVASGGPLGESMYEERGAQQGIRGGHAPVRFTSQVAPLLPFCTLTRTSSSLLPSAPPRHDPLVFVRLGPV